MAYDSNDTNNYDHLMADPLDPNDHPTNNLAPKGGVPLQQSGNAYLTQEQLAEGIGGSHNTDFEKLGSKFKVSRKKSKKS